MNSKFTDLVLLVGTNPLPVYVVSAFFLLEEFRPEKLENIWFIFTDQTENYKYNIERLLRKKFSEQFQKIKEENFFKSIRLDTKDSAVKIRDKITSSLIELKNEPMRKVHLNYTGGTKAMGVHSYLAINKLFEDNAEFSYLSADNFNIYNDQYGKAYFISGKEDLRSVIKLSFAELYELHGYEPKNESEKTSSELSSDKVSDLKIETNYLEELISKDKIDSFINAINIAHNNDGKEIDVKGFYNKIKNLKGTETKKMKVLQEELNRMVNIKVDEIVEKFYNSIDEKFRIFKDNEINLNINASDIKETIRFITGEWLEQVLFRRLASNKYFNDKLIYIDKVIRKKEWKSKDNDVQLDVIIMRGYQVFIVSVTTDDTKSICKSKGFEVLLRASQLGGDESKAVLLTKLNENTKKNVQEELQENIGKNRIKVLGIDDWKENLVPDIIKFMEENN